jgi:ribosomal protein L34E
MKKCSECGVKKNNVKMGSEYPELMQAASYISRPGLIIGALLCPECAARVAADLRKEIAQVLSPFCHICGKPAHHVKFDAQGKAFVFCDTHEG